MNNKDSNHSYVNHWIMQRVSGVALIFLFSWLMYVLLRAYYEPEFTIQSFLDLPMNLIGVIGLFNIAIYHGILGLRVVCEDYIHDVPVRTSIIVVSYIIGFGTMCVLTGMLLINFWLKS